MDEENERVVPFAGLTRHDDATFGDIPEVGGHGSSMKWWTLDYLGMSETSLEDELELPGEGFLTAVNSLPRATTTEAGWKHPVTGEWVQTEKHNAIIDPAKVEQMGEPLSTQSAVREYVDGLSASELLDLANRLGLDTDGPPSRDNIADAMQPGDGVLFNIPTDSYEVINPATSLKPLANVLREEDFGDSVFGEFRVTRGGGRVSGDIYLDGMHVQTPETAGMTGDEGDAIADGGDAKPTVVGLEFGYDFFGDTAFRVRGTALRTSCMNAMRAVTDWEVVKHTGDVEERVDWERMYVDLLEELDLKRDQLSQIIHEASELTLDLADLPEDFAVGHDSLLEAFYDYAGLPGYLAEKAADEARTEADDPFEPSWWDLYNGATFAVTHYARGDVVGGGAVDNYHRLADDLLMNPPAFEERVQQAYEGDREEDAELESEGGGSAAIARTFESVRDKKEQYQERNEEMKALASLETAE